MLVGDRHSPFAERLFGALGVWIVTGHHFLGGFLGDYSSQVQYVVDKVQIWVTHLLSLTKVAEREPQAAYAALTKSFQNEWTFFSIYFQFMFL